MNKIKLSAVLALCFALSACSALQGVGKAVGALSPSGPSLDATAQVGQGNEAVDEGTRAIDTRRVDSRREDRRVEASVEEGGVSTVTQTETRRESGETSGVSLSELAGDIQALNINNVPPLFLFLFALGWLLPGPVEIVKGIGKMLMFFRTLITGREK